TPRPRHPPRRYTRAIASFDNLVVLANYEEHLREARKMVWRDRGEPAVEVHDLWECLEHGLRGGLRAGTLAFTIRSGVNLILLLARIQRARKVPRKTRIWLVQHALFGADSFRFGAMLACRTLPILLNAFPLLNLANVPFRLNLPGLATQLPSHHSLGPPVSFAAQAHQTWLLKRSARWHSIVAGAVAGGVAISFESLSRRKVIAQQYLFGLQGSYNAYSEKRGFRVPHGDVLVFVFSKVRSNNDNTAGQIPKEVVSVNRDIVRMHTFDPVDLEHILSRPYDLHPGNVTVLEAWRAAHPPYGPCSGSHPHIVSCAFAPIERFFAVFRWTLPIYAHAVVRTPVPMVLRAGWGSTRSAAFLAAFVAIYQGYFCSTQNAHRALVGRPHIPTWLLAALVSKPSFWLGGLLAGMSVLIEAKHRRGELAMYVLPKGLESAWVAARGKGLVFRTGKHGSALLTAIGMGMVMVRFHDV
ncbi:hypothetical protein BJV77DRAFT_1024182, partial [Russula vinacea]